MNLHRLSYLVFTSVGALGSGTNVQFCSWLCPHLLVQTPALLLLFSPVMESDSSWFKLFTRVREVTTASWGLQSLRWIRHRLWTWRGWPRGKEHCDGSWSRAAIATKLAFCLNGHVFSYSVLLSLACPIPVCLLGWSKEKLALRERDLEAVLRLSRHRTGITCLTLLTLCQARIFPLCCKCWTDGWRDCVLMR